MSDLRLIRGASPSRFGGIHWFEWKPKDEAQVGPSARDVWLLHPLDHDGAFFTKIAPCLAGGRIVIAADYPGCGKSDPPDEPATPALYAAAISDTIRARDTHGAVDVLGFQAGCLVGLEMCRTSPDEVHRVVLVDVPTEGVAPEMARVEHPCLVVATDPALGEYGRTIASLLPRGEFLESMGAAGQGLQAGAEPISRAALQFFDR